MIIAQKKPVKNIMALIDGYHRILLAGCGGCTTVCLAGGEKETEMLASCLRIMFRLKNKSLETVTKIAIRQCDPEFITVFDNLVKDVEAIVSLGCGIGTQYLAEHYKDKWVVPALDTKFIGGCVAHGVWEERCGLCGDCVLHNTGGICPITRCSKSILNGPCGGSSGGKCEINREIDCGWQLIYDKMKALGKLDVLMAYQPPKDWSTARSGGLRQIVMEDVVID